jgi:hypothetical protein
MSVVAGASENDWDTTRTGGAEACGGWVGAGSDVRLGVAIADAGGTGVAVGTALATVGAGETGSDGLAAGDAHAAITISASATADRRLTPVR